MFTNISKSCAKLHVQLVKGESEQSSFTSDMALFSELDEIAGTSGSQSYKRQVIIHSSFLIVSAI